MLPTLSAFIDELNSQFSAAEKRDWFRGKVIEWLCERAPDDGTYPDVPAPLPPRREATLGIPAMCAALAAVQSEVFQGPPLFVLPDEFRSAEPGTERYLSRGYRRGAVWIAFTSTVRDGDPAEWIVTLRAMQRDVEHEWQSQKEPPLKPMPVSTPVPSKSATRPKRSTEKGEGTTKLISALTKHHQYANGGCLNLEPIGNNALARLAEVAPSTATVFFDRKFNDNKSGGYSRYRRICGDKDRLLMALKLLNQEITPTVLLRGAQIAERDCDDGE